MASSEHGTNVSDVVAPADTINMTTAADATSSPIDTTTKIEPANTTMNKSQPAATTANLTTTTRSPSSMLHTLMSTEKIFDDAESASEATGQTKTTTTPVPSPNKPPSTANVAAPQQRQFVAILPRVPAEPSATKATSPVNAVASPAQPVKTAIVPATATATSISATKPISTSPASCTVTAASASTTAPHNTPVTAPESRTRIIECPHPNDILFPVRGYQLWVGNVRFIAAIAAQQATYRSLIDDDPTKPQHPQRVDAQTRVVTELIQTLTQQNGGRFLRAVITTSEQTKTTGPTSWMILSEAVKVQIVHRALCEDLPAVRRNRRKERRQRRHARRKVRRQRRHERELQAMEELERKRWRERQERLEALDDMHRLSIAPEHGALATLYYVPSYYPSWPARIQTEETEEYRKRPRRAPGVPGLDDDSLSSTSSSSDEENLDKSIYKTAAKSSSGGPVKKKRKGANIARATAAAAIANRKHAKWPPDASGTSNKKLGKKQNSKDEWGEDLPKGVTVRPSGKWQAQTYFAGQSRYVGVYDTSRLAARAYVVVQEYLKLYRGTNAVCKTSPKEELARIFSNARRAADEAVQELILQLQAEDIKAEIMGKFPGGNSSAKPASTETETKEETKPSTIESTDATNKAKKTTTNTEGAMDKATQKTTTPTNETEMDKAKKTTTTTTTTEGATDEAKQQATTTDAEGAMDKAKMATASSTTATEGATDEAKQQTSTTTAEGAMDKAKMATATTTTTTATEEATDKAKTTTTTMEES